MERVELKPGVTVSIEVTTEGKAYLVITNNSVEASSILQSVCKEGKIEVGYEGDYKGEKLNKVKMEKSEIDSLESTLGSSCLTYWIISLNSFADSEPAKFKKYKSHRACIQNWHRMRLEKGMVFSHIHPSGPGYYFRREIESLKPEQLKLR